MWIPELQENVLLCRVWSACLVCICEVLMLYLSSKQFLSVSVRINLKSETHGQLIRLYSFAGLYQLNLLRQRLLVVKRNQLMHPPVF